MIDDRQVIEIDQNTTVLYTRFPPSFGDFNQSSREYDILSNFWFFFFNQLSNMKPLFLASGPAFKRKYVHMTPFINIDVYSLVCSVLHLNLDSNLKSIDRYCEMDGKSSRISKMLAPIKHTGDDGPNSSADKQSVNSKETCWFGPKMRWYFSC